MPERKQQVEVINSRNALNINSTILEGDENFLRTGAHESFKSFSDASKRLNFRRRALAVQERVHAIAGRGLALGGGIDIIKTAVDASGPGQSGINVEKDTIALIALFGLWIINAIVDSVTANKKQETENKIKAVTQAQQSGLIQYRDVYPLDL